MIKPSLFTDDAFICPENQQKKLLKEKNKKILKIIRANKRIQQGCLM